IYLHDRSDRQRNQARFVNIPLAKGLAASAQIAFRRDVMCITDCSHRRLDTWRPYSGGLSVNSFCARMFGLALFVFLALAIAVQPAIAQLDQAKDSHQRPA